MRASNSLSDDLLQLQAKAVAAAANAILITDSDGIASVNPAFTRLTGYSAEEAIGRTPGFLKFGAQDPASSRATAGSFRVESHVGEGSVMIVDLPARVPPADTKRWNGLGGRTTTSICATSVCPDWACTGLDFDEVYRVIGRTLGSRSAS